MGLHIQEIVPVFEAAGRSLLPLATHSAAPDEGNMHLHNWATTDRALSCAAGEGRDAFSMTEPPPGARSHPRMIQTRAVRDGSDWVINGHKWLTTDGEIADFFIIMALTDPDAHPYRGCTQFLASRDSPGIQIVREAPVKGTKDFGGQGSVPLDATREEQGHVEGLGETALLRSL